jgi:hypothetical protein
VKIKKLFFFTFLFLLISAGMTSLASAQRTQGETYTGTMVGLGGQLGSVSRTFTLTLEGRTSDSDAASSVAILSEGGQEALLKAIQGNRLGHFAFTGQVGREVNFVSEASLPNGERKIMVLFERWMNLYEVRAGARSTDYPFGYVELIVDASGSGQGTFIPAARVQFKNNVVEVENFGTFPARLFGVRMRKS